MIQEGTVYSHTKGLIGHLTTFLSPSLLRVMSHCYSAVTLGHQKSITGQTLEIAWHDSYGLLALPVDSQHTERVPFSRRCVYRFYYGRPM